MRYPSCTATTSGPEKLQARIGHEHTWRFNYSLCDVNAPVKGKHEFFRRCP